MASCPGTAQALHRTIEKHDATIEMLLTPTPQARAALNLEP